MARRYKGKLLYIVKVKIKRVAVTKEYETIKILVDNSGFLLKVGETGVVSQKLLFDDHGIIEFIFGEQESNDR